MKYNFLLEIGTEELPSKILCDISEKLTNRIILKFKEKNIIFKKKKIFASPRRLGIQLTELYYLHKKKFNTGPSTEYALNKNGTLNSIAYAWIKKYNLKKKQIIYIKNKKKIFLSYKLKKIKIQILIKKIIKKILSKFYLIKLMKWGHCKERFIRPVKNIILLLNKNIIKLNIFQINTKREIYGNPYIYNKKITINNPAEYTEKILKLGQVINNFKKRRNKIKNDIINIVNKIEGKVKIKKNILNEITSLVEWPKICLAKFKKKFIRIPKEFVIHILENFQKCIPIYNQLKKLTKYFIFISNIQPKNMHFITAGNQKVINARLNDANFFYKNDLKKIFEKNYFKLKNIIFHKKIGNLLEKTKRLQILIITISKKNMINIKYAIRSAYLSKCDLLTQIVTEFPEMKGIAGMYYAKKNKEKKEIYTAIKEHYKPCFSNDNLPKNNLSSILSIVDKIDNLTGMFIINKQPKGKNDLFGLRRITIGIIKIIIQNKIKINLNKIVKTNINLYTPKKKNKKKKIHENILKFIENKVLEYYIKLGYKKNIVYFILLQNSIKNLLFINKIIINTHDFLNYKHKNSIIKIYKRINNFLKKNENIKNKNINIKLIHHKEEKKILYLTTKIKKKIKILLKQKKIKAIKQLLIFKKPINIFFKKITINKKNTYKKNNRILLIYNIKKIFLKIINFNLFI